MFTAIIISNIQKLPLAEQHFVVEQVFDEKTNIFVNRIISNYLTILNIQITSVLRSRWP